MSFFYLSAVKGTIPLHVLEVIVEHLTAIHTNTKLNFNEFVIEGSVYDTIGHYTLCLAAIMGRDADVCKFVLRTEIALFKRRLEAFSAYELRSFARKLLKYIRKLNVSRSFIKPLQILCQHLGIRHMSQHLRSQCGDQCTFYNIRVKFIHCLKFISQRSIEINNGIGKIPCNKWLDYLIILFSMNLKQRLFNTNLDCLNCDPRITQIVENVKTKVCSGKLRSPNVLHSQKVDEMSIYFPPCMLNLHLHLRMKHRLSHDQRFNYSLFLKDIGMPVNEAVEFWKNEYSNAPALHSCCHNWAKDEKKFLYGIRHMYGLEGSRKNYACRNCNQIQDIQNACSEGGCPFKSFEDKQMQELLGLNEKDFTLSQINIYRSRGQYSKACALYLETKHKQILDNKINLYLTPVKYFMMSVHK